MKSARIRIPVHHFPAALPVAQSGAGVVAGRSAALVGFGGGDSHHSLRIGAQLDLDCDTVPLRHRVAALLEAHRQRRPPFGDGAGLVGAVIPAVPITFVYQSTLIGSSTTPGRQSRLECRKIFAGDRQFCSHSPGSGFSATVISGMTGY